MRGESSPAGPRGQSGEPNSRQEEVQSAFRVIGFAGDGRSVMLYDVDREGAIWSWTAKSEYSYPATLEKTLKEVQPGNLVQATVAGDPHQSAPWEIRSMEIVSQTTLAFIPTEDYVPGRADEAWDTRDQADDVGLVTFTHQDTDEVLVELQTFPETFEGEEVWEGLRRGTLSIEPWYDELTSTPAGADHLYIVNPELRPYVAFLCFPRHNSAMEEVKENLKAYVQDHPDISYQGFPEAP